MPVEWGGLWWRAQLRTHAAVDASRLSMIEQQAPSQFVPTVGYYAYHPHISCMMHDYAWLLYNFLCVESTGIEFPEDRHGTTRPTWAEGNSAPVVFLWNHALYNYNGGGILPYPGVNWWITIIVIEEQYPCCFLFFSVCEYTFRLF